MTGSSRSSTTWSSDGSSPTSPSTTWPRAASYTSRAGCRPAPGTAPMAPSGAPSRSWPIGSRRCRLGALPRQRRSRCARARTGSPVRASLVTWQVGTASDPRRWRLLPAQLWIPGPHDGGNPTAEPVLRRRLAPAGTPWRFGQARLARTNCWRPRYLHTDRQVSVNTVRPRSVTIIDAE